MIIKRFFCDDYRVKSLKLSNSSFFGNLFYKPLQTKIELLRNLHQYPKARYKSHVKDRIRFSRSWLLKAGNNYELIEDRGHELEATQNFAKYKTDIADKSITFETTSLKSLPPRQRLDALVELMRKRWKVRDNNTGFDKATMLLQSLECFYEMNQIGDLPEYDKWQEQNQDVFQQYVDGCVHFAHRTLPLHPDAVGMIIRSAQICHSVGCHKKYEELIQVSKHAANKLVSFSLQKKDNGSVPLIVNKLQENSNSLANKLKMELKDLFPDKSFIHARRRPRPYFVGARHRRIFFLEEKK